MNISKPSPKETFVELNGTMELFNFIKDTPSNNYSRKHREEGFCDYTWEETLTGLTDGWREGTQEIESIKSKILSREGVYYGGHGIEYDVTGDFIDMGAYLTGEPECMGRIVPREIIKDEIHILVSAAYSSRIGSDIIKTRGAAITALIEKLMENYEVKLSIGNRVYFQYKRKTNIEVLLNIDLQNEFSRDVIAFCLSHPGYVRRCQFALRERIEKVHSLQDDSYGVSSSSTIALNNLRRAGIKYYYFDRLLRDEDCWPWKSPELALQEVNRIIESLK